MITTRVPQIDWKLGFERRWNGGNPAVTHFFNALSFLFPQGEKYFIDIAKEVLGSIAHDSHFEIHLAVKSFISQESIHGNQHVQYNAVLEKQGFENIVHGYIAQLIKRNRQNYSPLTNLANVCAYEHYTAVLGNFILSNPQILKGAQPHMALIWGWHSVEETEHKSVCFDLYKIAGGGWLRRVVRFLSVTLDFNIMFTRQYFYLLNRDGCLKPNCLLGTLGKSLKFFFGWPGVVWPLLWSGLQYFSPFFHPWKHDNRSLLESWLKVNQSSLREIPNRDHSNSLSTTLTG